MKRPGDFCIAVALAAIGVLSACSPPKQSALIPFVPGPSQQLTQKLPPWTIVCDANGRYNYTWDTGRVNRYETPFRSREEAEKAMAEAKWLKSHPSEVPEFQEYPIDGYKVCPDP
jgi:hypothetical protein